MNRLVLAAVIAIVVAVIVATPAGSLQADLSYPHAADRILVRCKSIESMPQSAEILATYDAVAPGLALVSVDDVGKALEESKSDPNVLYAEPDYEVQLADTIPDDYYTYAMWGLNNIHAPAAWDVVHDAPAVIVAVIDTGTDYNHPDLAANIWTNPGEVPGNGLDDDGNGYVDDVHGWDFYANDNDPMDESGHGTHTAGTICAAGNNGFGIVGVAWRCQIMPLRFMGAQGGFSSGALEALNYAVAKGAKVSNNSWGGDGYSASLYTAIQNAGVAGHLFVAAAGNNASDNDIARFYPSSYNLDNILAVTALDKFDRLASFSNYGAQTVDLAAPGVGIVSTVPGGYAAMSGTSMAAPHVAGAAALLYALHPDWTALHVKTQLVASARPLDDLQGRTVAGGTLDLAGALGPAFPEPTPTPVPSVHVGALSGTASVTTRNRWQAQATILVHDQGEAARAGVTVTGRWSDGFVVTCRTDSFGSCVVSSASDLKGRSVRFDVTGLTLAGAVYDPAANHVSSVTISKP